MNKEELYESIDTSQSVTQKYFGLSLKKFLVLSLFVTLLGVYFGMILYGTNSLEVLLGLGEYESRLHKETDRLKKQNAQLQREYFELKEISAQ